MSSVKEIKATLKESLRFIVFWSIVDGEYFGDKWFPKRPSDIDMELSEDTENWLESIAVGIFKDEREEVRSLLKSVDSFTLTASGFDVEVLVLPKENHYSYRTREFYKLLRKTQGYGLRQGLIASRKD